MPYTLALKILLNPGLTIQQFADSLGLCLSAIHRSVGRATSSGLLRGTRIPFRQAFREFVLHGLRYAFPAVRGSLTPGMPTAHAALPLSDRRAPRRPGAQTKTRQRPPHEAAWLIESPKTWRC